MKLYMYIILLIYVYIIEKITCLPGTCQNHSECIEFCQLCYKRKLCCPIVCWSNWAEGCDNKCVNCSTAALKKQMKTNSDKDLNRIRRRLR